MLINLIQRFRRTTNFMVLMALLKLLLYQSAEKKIKYQEVQSLLKPITKEGCLKCSILKENLEVEFPTQIIAAKTNILSTKQNNNLSYNHNHPKPLLKIDNNQAKNIASKSINSLLYLAKANFEEKIVVTFIDRLYHQNLLQTELVETSSFSYSRRTVTIRSSFEISENRKKLLKTAIREKISANAEIGFEISKDLISSMQLCDRNYKISWDLKHYLTEIT